MHRLLSILKWTAVAVIAAAALLWVGDTVYVHIRLSHKSATDPIDTIKFRPTYLIPRKDGRAELDFGDPETQICVHSLFPQLGYNPCWYVLRQSKKPIPIAAIPSNLPLGCALYLHVS